MKIVAKIMLVVMMMMTINVEVDHNLIPIALMSHYSMRKYQGLALFVSLFGDKYLTKLF